MELTDLQNEIRGIFNPEEDDSFRDWPHPRIEKIHKINLDYLRTMNWEGSSMHQFSRLVPQNHSNLTLIIRNSDIAKRLFEAGLFLFGDSIIAYHQSKERNGMLHYYPTIILTFWSAFETFVRYSSELMLITVKDIPSEIESILQEKDKRYPVLERYEILLKCGYGLTLAKKSKHWSDLKRAQKLRDYYTHIDVKEIRSILTTDLVSYMESVLLGIIWPSSIMKRTQLTGVFRYYDTLYALKKLSRQYEEQPLLKDWVHVDGLFYCPFENVDNEQFPNLREKREKA